MMWLNFHDFVTILGQYKNFIERIKRIKHEQKTSKQHPKQII